jgi:hypothetical protein
MSDNACCYFINGHQLKPLKRENVKGFFHGRFPNNVLFKLMRDNGSVG